MLMFALPKASYKFNVILIKIQNSILHRMGGEEPTNPKIHIETNPTLDEQSNSEQKTKAQVSQYLISFHTTEPQ